MLEAIVTAPARPRGRPDAPLKAMLVDSWYDPYLGVIVLVPHHRRRPEGHEAIRIMMSTGANTTI